MNRIDSYDTTIATRSSTPPADTSAPHSRERVTAIARRDMHTPVAPCNQRSSVLFPIADFHQAVVVLDFDTIKSILIAYGFKPHEVEFLQGKTKVLSPNAGPDHLNDILLYIAIRKGFLELLPALPAYIHPDPEKMAVFAKLATAQFCKNMNVESFDLLRAVVKKYRPANSEVCIKKAYKETLDAEAENIDILIERFRRSFSDFHLSDLAKDSDEKVDSPEPAQTQPAPEFPKFRFQMALANLESDELCRLLIGKGWQESDLDIIKMHIDQLLSERISWSQGNESGTPLNSLDDITSRLVMEGISSKQNSLIDILPLFPPLDSFNKENLARSILSTAADSLREEPNDPFLIKVFIMIIQKYRPTNTAESIERIGKTAIDPENMTKIRSAG